MKNLASLNALPGIGGANRKIAEAFSPLDIPGLALWLDASDTSTIDTSTASPDVDSWTDKSPNGLIFSQGTASKKPHIVSAANGRNAISFDGVDDFLIASSVPFTGNVGTIFTVFQFDGSPPNHNQNMIAVGDTNAAAYVILCSTQNVAGDDYDRVSEKPNDAGTSNLIRSDEVVSESATGVVTTSSNGSAFSIRRNGADLGLVVENGSNNGNLFADTSGLDNITLGTIKFNNTFGQYFKGMLYESIYYDGVTLTSNQINQVEQWLANRQKITL